MAKSPAKLPPDSDYVIANDAGHLTIDGKRHRFWAAIGKPLIRPKFKKDDSPEVRAQKIENAKKGTDRILDHLQYVGFNAIRLWDVLPNRNDYKIGDGSSADNVDYLIAEAKKRGFRIWTAGFGNRTGYPSPDDVDIIDDPATAEAWKAAIAETLGSGIQYTKKHRKLDLRHNIAKAWDPRLEALEIEAMRRNADHFNKYTGLRWADDPVFAIWELSNEEWWMRKMVGGQWKKLPEFFRTELFAKWNAFLLEKYKTDAALKKAWGGLLPGESLKQGTVLFAPMAGKTKAAISINDSNVHARESLMALDSVYTRDDFEKQRGADVLEFLVKLQLGYKERQAAAVKTFGKSARLSPTIYDTGIGYEIQSQNMHQNADAVAHNAYVNGWGPEYTPPNPDDFKDANRLRLKTLDAERIAANDGRWVNWLLKPPGIAQGVPWLEHNRVEGKPYIVYETQIQQPAKYRADYPLRLLALASIQDWDWVSWHYFSPHDKVGIVERPFDRPLDVTWGSHPQGYHFTYDEVQNAMMRAAGFLFRDLAFKPAPNPTRFIYGSKSLYDPASMDYAGSYGETGFDMLQTTYQYGVRIEIDPTREDDEVIGPVVKFDDRNTHNPYDPTEEILFDWKKGILKMDAPDGVVFTGLMANYGDSVKFENDVTLTDVKINNPEGIYDPVTEDEQYISFALYSKDGLPLSKTKKASLSLVSTSFNSGFRFGTREPKHHGIPQGTQAGGLPVLVARVGATVKAPALNGMSYQLKDWNGYVIGEGKVTDGTMNLSADKPVFVVELTR